MTAPSQPAYWLRLYIAGQGDKSRNAVRNLKQICQTALDGNCAIELIDITADPRRAAEDQILAIPTLVRHMPPPLRRLVGDLSLTDKVLAGLNISPKASST